MTRKTQTRPETNNQATEQPSARYGRSNTKENTQTNEETKGKQETACPECGGSIIENEQRGERACTDCGLVIDEDEIDPGPEWRAFNQQEKQNKQRVGAPETNMRHDKGLTTNIDWRNKDAYGNQLSSRKRKQMERLRTWNERYRTQDSQERNLKQALGEIDRMASALGLPQNVRETSSMIYRQCLNTNMLPGRSIEGMATASLYAGARLEEVPRSLDELETVSRVDRNRIASAYRYMNRELELKIGPIDPAKYIPRFTSQLDSIRQDTENKALELMEYIKRNNIHTGKSPPGIAAATIYTAAVFCNEDITQGELSDITGITEVTIREGKDLIIKHGEEEWLLGDYTDGP